MSPNSKFEIKSKYSHFIFFGVCQFANIGKSVGIYLEGEEYCETIEWKMFHDSQQRQRVCGHGRGCDFELCTFQAGKWNELTNNKSSRKWFALKGSKRELEMLKVLKPVGNYKRQWIV